MHDPKKHLQDTLKKTRHELGISLDKASVKTGVSKAMLGQIERGESSPTIAILWKIVNGLEVSMSRFLEPDSGEEVSISIRNADDIRTQPTEDGMLVAPLFPYNASLGYEFFEITFLPGYERLSEPHQKGVVEQISVIKGKIEIWVDDQWHELSKGQSIRFPGDQEHSYRNLSQKPAVIHDLMHYKDL